MGRAALLRRFSAGLLALSTMAPMLCAQVPGGDPGPEFLPPDMQRLPWVETIPPAGGELWPSGQTPPGAASPPTDAALPGLHPPPPYVEEPLVDQPLAPQTLAEPEPPIKLWEGSFELGLDGTEGNSQTLSFRLGLDAKRSTPLDTLTLDLDYHRNSTEEQETAHRALLDWRYERLWPDSLWTCFVHGTVDYDEFKAFDLRVTADTGLGYHLIKTESTSLAARAGGGFSHEIGGPDDSYVPEAVFGLDFQRQLNKRQKLTGSVEYTPDVTDFGQYRLTARTGWELLVDEEMNLSLKLSVLDRYDSTPGGAKPNDLDYSAVLLWKF